MELTADWSLLYQNTIKVFYPFFDGLGEHYISDGWNILVIKGTWAGRRDFQWMVFVETCMHTYLLMP